MVKKENGNVVPGEAALAFSKQFEEIMIDEYQDSNMVQELILTSISRCSMGQNNLFMVGDVKQSIYRFRLACPELFMEKYDTYTTEDSENQKIELHKNFRSRKEVLFDVNFIFRKIMHRNLGNVEYDDNAALYAGIEFPKLVTNVETDDLTAAKSPLSGSEILLFDADSVTETNAREAEARMIGGQIKAIVGRELVYDKESRHYRKAEYRDIVILLRSLSGWSEEFLAVLSDMGIPAYTGTRSGYFSALEVRTVLSFLRVLDNPRQDIPFTAVLTSPIGTFATEELAKIRTENPEVSYYEACRAYENAGSDGILREKLQKFFKVLEHFRSCVPYMPMHELLWKIYEETGYFDYVCAMPAGSQRKANLEMLAEKAAAYESTSYRGLFNFVRYIENLQKYEVDFGEASTIGEEENTVRIMSIHKSKGLEFPIVFAAGMGKRFNMSDASTGLVIHQDLGIGMQAVDPKERTQASSLVRQVIQKQIRLESLGEELRVLYVALTRAKEKLILTGTVKKIEDYQAVQAEAQDWQEEKLPYGMREGARCYWDWIFPALAGANEEFPVQILEMEHLITDQVTDREDRVRQRAAYETWDPQEVFDATIRKDLEEKFSYVYPYGYLQDIPAKVSVSELKKQGREEPEEETVYLYVEKEQEPIIPDFMKEEQEPLLQGAARGTVYHRILECLDYARVDSQQAIEKQIEELLQEEKISKEAAKVVRSSQISWFVRSAVGKRMKEASALGTLHREQQFVMSIDASERNPAWDQGEQILVQGIIDAFWEEADGLVLVDYKTDHVKEGQELIERYQRQMHYYSQALERAYGKKVKECYLYSFALGKAVAVEV